MKRADFLFLPRVAVVTALAIGASQGRSRSWRRSRPPKMILEIYYSHSRFVGCFVRCHLSVG